MVPVNAVSAILRLAACFRADALLDGHCVARSYAKSNYF